MVNFSFFSSSFLISTNFNQYINKSIKRVKVCETIITTSLFSITQRISKVIIWVLFTILSSSTIILFLFTSTSLNDFIVGEDIIFYVRVVMILPFLSIFIIFFLLNSGQVLYLIHKTLRFYKQSIQLKVSFLFFFIFYFFKLNFFLLSYHSLVSLHFYLNSRLLL